MPGTLLYNARAFSVTWVPIAARPLAGLRTPAAALESIGAAGYTSPNVTVIDLLGLADPVDSHFKFPTRGLPGHEKLMPPPWFAAMATAPGQLLQASDFIVPGSPAFDVRLFSAEVTAARVALQCGRIKDVVQAADAPMSGGRFVSNLFGAWSRTRVSIPIDPFAAVREFCPKASP
ncbi:MAG TPA: hypothetical protein VGI86_18205 [Acidimicrobiia bacterium]